MYRIIIKLKIFLNFIIEEALRLTVLDLYIANWG